MDIDENNGTLEEGGENVQDLPGVATQEVSGQANAQDNNEEMLDETEQDELNAQWDGPHNSGV